MPKEEEIRRIREAKAAMKSLRLTKSDDQPFVISMEDGGEVKDSRPIGQNMLSRQAEMPQGSIAPAPAPEANLSHLSSLAQVQSERFGVAIVLSQNTPLVFEYTHTVNGKPVLLFTIPATETGLREAGVLLKQLIEDNTRDLHLRYGITFSTAGKTLIVSSQSTINKSLINASPGNTESCRPCESLRTRQPKLFELDELSESLAASDPAHCISSKDQLHIAFVERPRDFPLDKKAILDIQALSEEAHLYIFPSSLKPNQAGHTQPNTPNTPNTSLKKLGITGEDIHTAYAELLYKLGWITGCEPGTGQIVWTLQAKDGYCYSNGPDSKEWLRRDKEGWPLDGFGMRTSSMQHAAKIAHEQMRELALVKPLSNCFGSVTAEIEAALIAFRSGVAERMQLLRQHRPLYDEAKRLDQVEINDEYGTQADGQPNKIRLPSSKLVSNKAEMQKEIARFEGS